MLFKKLSIQLLFIIIFPMVVSANERLAGDPHILSYGKLMSAAYQIGKEIGYPETIQALLLRETNGNRYRHLGPAKGSLSNQCYGVMQIKLDTAKFVMKKLWRLPKSDLLPDQELREKIHNDHILNIKIATSYFKYLLSLNPGPEQWDKAVLSYNIGSNRLREDGKVDDPDGYVESVRTIIKTNVQKFNSIHNIN
jgi:hypothetical protein